MSPFISSSDLSPGSREAKVQRAKVCLNCAEPSVATSSYWSLPVWRYLSNRRCKGSSLRDELRAIWPKSRRCLLVTKWESGEQPVVPLTSAFDTWRVYGILKILHSAHMSNASRRESRYFVVAHVSHPYIKTGTKRRNLVSSLMLDFQMLLSNIFMQNQAMPIRRKTSPLLPPEESIMHRHLMNAYEV